MNTVCLLCIVFEELIHFICCIELFVVLSVQSVVMSPDFIPEFHCQFHWYFLVDYLLFHWVFFLLFSCSWFSCFYHISFLLLVLGLFCPPSFRVLCSIWNFSSFLLLTFSAMNFLTLLVVFYKFWCALFSFSFSSVYFWIYFETFSWPMCCLEVFCFIFRCLGVSLFSEIKPYYFSSFNLLPCVLWPRIWS